MGTSVKDGAVIHGPVSFEIIHKVCAIAMLLSALLVQGAQAQLRIIGSGFIPEPDGYRSDDPPPAQRTSLAPGQIIKDCADCPEMVVIPAGSFEMGSNENADERPVHRVNVPSFLIGKTEVTQDQWKAVMGNNPSHFSTCGDDCPVERISWTDAQEFTQRLNQKTGKQYRLPTEAEWEYAARAGSNAKWSFGDSEPQLGDHAWYRVNSQNRTQRVSQKRSNAFGLYDMHGNVWEWVQDCWHDNYAGAPTDGSAWTTGCSGSSRVLRGGSWDFILAGRSAHRSRYTPDFRISGGGFRLARQIDQSDFAPLRSAAQSGAEAAAVETAVKLAVERVLAEVAQKAAAERAASAAAPKLTPLRSSNPANPGQTIKDCSDCPDKPVAPLAPPVAQQPAGQPAVTLPASSPSAVTAPQATPTDDEINWLWPANGPLIGGFDEIKNRGVDIGGSAGDPVLAAADGRVVYAGAGLRGYGNMIILKHNNTYLTAYAHNQALLIKEDQSVRRGQKIAEMGNSDADRVKLHFEVRRQGKPVDPIKFLPPR